MGCDSPPSSSLLLHDVFQSTHPHGVRHFNGVLPKAQYGVSIHAPTWGATTLILCSVSRFSFQSTHPHGVRLLLQVETLILDRFQSTHPHGVRQPWGLINLSYTISFNPRTHMGCDFNGVLPKAQYGVSIHAPTWGATLRLVRYKLVLMFQSTHPHGVRPT